MIANLLIRVRSGQVYYSAKAQDHEIPAKGRSRASRSNDAQLGNERGSYQQRMEMLPWWLFEVELVTCCALWSRCLWCLWSAVMAPCRQVRRNRTAAFRIMLQV
jgi:hypothetical protein